MNTRKIVLTGLLLAICIAFQVLKSLSVYITGPAVNAILLLATLYVGLPSGIFIAICAPLIAYLVGATPIINLLPIMLPIIMVGNALITIPVHFLKERNLPLGMVIGSVLKALFLFVFVCLLVLPGAAIPEKVATAAKGTFSITQLITAAIGSVIAYIIYKRLPNKMQ